MKKVALYTKVCFWLLILAETGSGCGPKTTLAAPDFQGLQLQSSQLTLTPPPDSTPADGVSQAGVELQLKEVSANQYYDSAAFTVLPPGVFMGGAMTVNVPTTIGNPSQAEVYVVSRINGAVTVSGSIGGTTQTAQVLFGVAYATDLQIHLDSAYLPSFQADSTGITATLLRPNWGRPTAGQVVHFTDFDSATRVSVGTFSNELAPCDTLGVATTRYWLRNNAYTGVVIIYGTVYKGTTIAAIDSNRIYVH